MKQVQKVKATILFLIVGSAATGAFSGCVDNPHNGVGGNASEEPNGSMRSYIEDGEKVRSLEEFIQNENTKILACDIPDEQEFKREISHTLNISHLSAVEGLLHYCKGAYFDSKFNETRAMNDTVDYFSEWNEIANSTYSEATSRIDNLTDVSNYVELQLVARLMTYNHLAASEIALAPDLVEGYLENGNELSLRTSFLKLSTAITISESILRFVALYPWEEGAPCSPPATLWEDVRSEYNEVLALAAEKSGPGDEKYVSRTYGKLLHSTGPRIDHFEEKGWWIGVAGMSFDWDRAYLENKSSGNAATPEQALLIISDYWSGTRSLAVDSQVKHYWSTAKESIETGFLWTDQNAVRAYTIPAITWGYGKVDCPG